MSVNDRIIKTEYSEVMQKSFIDYAMSVIIARALPDVRDGLKPVQRRTLYDMYELGIRYDRPYRKSARIVGDTMGKYHPHGDSSIYEALVVMSQDFKKGLPLVDGHGNFGNIEGDGAAAMRYTEATKAYMLDENITTRELMRYIKGPDFPTGGLVINEEELPDIYETGTGKIKIRGKVEVEKAKGGRINLVITQIPYTMIGAGISKFLMDVAALAETKKTQDIVDITNQSSKEGIRIVIELRKDADVENFKNMLYKKTRLEDTFGVNMLAIADGRPETMGIRQIIQESVKFQYEVATRKYTNLLARELERKEIQEGLIKACNVIDLIIEILRGSKDRGMAKACLVEGKTDGIKFKSKESKVMAAQLMFTEKQANAILDMRLYKLIGLEIEALINEHEDTMANIYRYEDILDRRDSMAQVIINELDEIKEEYRQSRRTVITQASEAVYVEKKIEEMDVVFLMDRFGYARTIDTATYERNKETADSENRYVFVCRNTGKVCLFTNRGQLHTLKVMDLPMGKFRDKGVPVDNISNYDASRESILYAASQSDLNLYRVIFATRQAMLKIVDGGEFDVAKRTVAATKLADDDEVISVVTLKEQRNIVLQSAEGYFLRFPVEEIPEKKKGAIGVRGMKLGAKDSLEAVYYTRNAVEQTIEYGGKEIELNKIKLGKRDGKGVRIRA